MQTFSVLVLGIIGGGLAGFAFGARKVAVCLDEIIRLRADLDLYKRVTATVPGIYGATLQLMREKRANFCPVER